MRTPLVKEYEMEEGTTPESWYRITVYLKDTNVVVDTILRPTMDDAFAALRRLGYRYPIFPVGEDQ